MNICTRKPVGFPAPSVVPAKLCPNSNVTKPILVKMVQWQLEKWLGKHFNPSKMKVMDLKHHLLNAGFTKEVQVTEDAEGGDWEREEQQQGEEGEVSLHCAFCQCRSVLMLCPSEEPWS
jgi:hypothetical protein